jgi:hypothetical protein
MTLPGAVEYVEKADTQTLVLPSTQMEKTQHVSSCTWCDRIEPIVRMKWLTFGCGYNGYTNTSLFWFTVKWKMWGLAVLLQPTTCVRGKASFRKCH